MKKILTIGLMLISVTAWADDFDITMDVIEADETFDEAIVNRIALPFESASASQAAKAKADQQDSLRRIEELERVVNERIGGSSPSGGGDSGGGSVPNIEGIEGIEIDSLPQGAELQTLLPQN